MPGIIGASALALQRRAVQTTGQASEYTFITLKVITTARASIRTRNSLFISSEKRFYDVTPNRPCLPAAYLFRDWQRFASRSPRPFNLRLVF